MKNNKKKASLEEAYELHGKVAKYLADNLYSDTKVVGMAINFLKNNNITVDINETQEMSSVNTSVNRFLDEINKAETSTETDKISVDEIIRISNIQ